MATKKVDADDGEEGGQGESARSAGTSPACLARARHDLAVMRPHASRGRTTGTTVAGRIGRSQVTGRIRETGGSVVGATNAPRSRRNPHTRTRPSSSSEVRPGEDLLDAVLPERPHAALDRGELDLLAARVLRGEALELLAHHHELEDADPAPVAGVAAARAALLAVQRRSVRRRDLLGREAGRGELLGGRAVGLAAVRAERRASRWASTAVTAEPVRNGSTPISLRRVSAPGASFVCSVERTKWPVSADSIEIFAVSTSRISPTMITSGSERRIVRSAEAKVRPAFGLICTWLMPASRYSTGSSTVMTLISGSVDLAQDAVQRGRLARAGRAGDEQRAGRLAMIALDLAAHLVGEAELGERRRPLRLVEQAHDDQLALDRGQHSDADVERAAGTPR